MYFLFLDESYDDRFFALGGPVIHDSLWKQMAKEMSNVKMAYGIPHNHEVKFRHLINKQWDPHTSRMSDTEVMSLGTKFFNIMKSKKKKVKSVVACIDKNEHFRRNPGDSEEDIYVTAISLVMERFQYVMFDQSDYYANGIVIIDQRQQDQDNLLRESCMKILSGGTRRTRFPNIFRPILIVSSDYTSGLQFADFCVGSVRRMFSTNFADARYFQIIKDSFITKVGDQKPVGLIVRPYSRRFAMNLKSLYR